MLKRIKRLLYSPFSQYLGILTMLLLLFVGGFVSLAYNESQQTLLTEFRNALRDESALLEAVYREEGLQALQISIERRIRTGDTHDVYMLLAPNGSVLSGNYAYWPQGVPFTDEATVTFFDPKTRDKVTAVVFLLYGDYRLMVGRHAVYEKLGQHLIRNYLVLSGLFLLVALMAAVLFSRFIQRRLSAITQTAHQVRLGLMDARVPHSASRDEINTLIIEINAMLDQQEKLLSYARQTSFAIAHDLRHPLAILRNELMNLAEDVPADYSERVDGIVGKVDEILGIFSALLRLGRLEAGTQQMNLTELNLYALAEDMYELYQPLFAEADCALQLHGSAAMAVADRELLSTALANLLENARCYGASPVVIEVGPESIGVRDHGKGVPASELARLTDPFYRAEASRSTAGNGLGLALVKAIAEVHGGSLEVTDAAPGLRVVLNLKPQG